MYRVVKGIALAFACILPAVAHAQDLGPVPASPGVGGRVRVTFGSERLVGVLTATDASTATIVVDGTVRVVPRASITSIQVSMGRRGRAGGGALLGAIGGLLVGLASPTDEPGNCLGSAACDRGQVVVGAMLGMTLVGAGIGAFIRTDRWVDARLDVDLDAAAGARVIVMRGRVRW